MIVLRILWHRFLWWWETTHPFEDRTIRAAIHLAEYNRLMNEWR